MRDAQWGLELRRGLFRSGRGAILREREVDGDVLRNTEAKRDRCPHLCACGIAPSPQAGFLQGVVEVRRIAQLAQQKGRKGGTQPLQPLAEVPRIGTGVFILPPAGRRLTLRESISHRLRAPPLLPHLHSRRDNRTLTLPRPEPFRDRALRRPPPPAPHLQTGRAT